MSIPIWMTLHVREESRTRIRLWLPLFLVWILLLPPVLLAAPLVLLAAWLTRRRGPGSALLRVFPMTAAVIWNLPGLHIEVEGPDNRVLVDIR